MTIRSRTHLFASLGTALLVTAAGCASAPAKTDAAATSAEAAKPAEGSCGAEKKGEGSCGAEKKAEGGEHKAGEGSCGEGSCGAAPKQ
jgi:uncharacterized low-complexity protein